MFSEAKESPWGVQPDPAPVPSPAVSGTPGLVPIKRSDDEEQIVWGEVYVPGVPDSQGDFMTAATIKEMAYNFMRKGITSNIDVNHSQEASGCYIVESFIARDDDPVFIPGSWVIGVKVPDLALWTDIKEGRLNGFSMDGFAVRVPTQLELEIPDFMTGRTEEADGHAHDFIVRYSETGDFLGGFTGPGPDGHIHRIARGTATEEVAGHSHRFSYVEVLLDAQAAA